MKKNERIIFKAVYAIIFTVLIPVGLYLWAYATEELVSFAPVESVVWGSILSSIGVILILWGWYALKVFGKGLPMNAFPPPKLVTQGPYRIVKHPIYVGFGIFVIGISIWTGSSSGLWLIAPITILSMISLVWGYERIDLVKRFPKSDIKVIISLPENSSSPLSVVQRIIGFLFLSISLILSNLIVFHLGQPPLENNAFFSANQSQMYFLEVISLIFFFIIPFLIKYQNQLREFLISSLMAVCLITYLSLLWPTFGGPFAQNLGWLLFPYTAVHIALLGIATYTYAKLSKRIRFFSLLIGLLIIIGNLVICDSIQMNVLSSLIIICISIYYIKIWEILRNLSEIIANSWKEWVIGPIRIINHGFYVAAATLFSVIACGLLIGASYAWAMLTFACVIIVSAALWAQIIEGSEKLKRPFGFNGAIVGVVFAGITVWAMGYNVWTMIGIAAVFMPWAQAVGRLRCLINGCCHGGKIDNERVGIRYFHARSRVLNISGLKGELLHPTPLYSIIWLFLIGFVLLALWLNNVGPSFIFGLYLILIGIGRFVEEAYRGEVQTPIIYGLRLYQWTSIASMIAGVVFTIIPTIRISSGAQFGWEIFIAAILVGLITFFAMGVDFPKSNARFSRLV